MNQEEYFNEDEIVNKFHEYYNEAVTKKTFGENSNTNVNYQNLQLKLLQTTQEFARSFDYELENAPTIKRKIIVFVKKVIRKLTRFILKPYADQMLRYQEMNGELSGELVKSIMLLAMKNEENQLALEENERIIEKYENSVGKNTRTIEDHERKIEDHERTIGDNKRIIEEQSKTIEEQNKAIEEKENKIKSQNDQIWKHEEAIYKLANDYNSTTALVLKLSGELDTKNEKINMSYSQAGEDKIIDFLMNYEKSEPSQFTYLDIGCNHYRDLNNTFRFYEMGMHGVLVDANPKFISLAEKHRTRDICINVGIANKNNQNLKFYILNGSGLSSFNKEVIDEAIKESPWLKVEKEIMVPVITINEIIEKNFSKVPELISLDIEGDELDVLETLDLKKYRPKIFVVETIAYKAKISLNNKRHDIVDFMENNNYKEYAFTGVNSIFVDGNAYIED